MPIVASIRIRVRATVWVLLTLALVATGLAVYPVLDGRTVAPADAVRQAERAIAAARTADAATWAPEALNRAVALFDEALTEHRRQELRFVSLRDYRPLRERLAEVGRQAETATREAAGQREDARASSTEILAEVGRLVSEVERLGDEMPLGRDTRRLRQQAMLRYHEACTRFSRGEFVQAVDKAEEARTAAETVLKRGAAHASRFVDPEQVRRWQGWISETLAWSRRTGKAAVIVYKEKNLVTLYLAGVEKHSYKADLGTDVVSRKLYSGDGATPEGRYRVAVKKGAGQTRYHRALLLDYPNAEDLQRLEEARRAGLVSAAATPGGLIEIHGEGGRGEDWTRGCPALSNEDMEDLYKRVEVGTPVTIVGGDGGNGRFSDLYRSLAAHVDGTKN